MKAARVRPAVVAGVFYPAEVGELRRQLADAFDRAVQPDADAPVPSALVAPHAGYVYSGPVAATAYLRLAPAAEWIHRVVVLGPSHRVPLRGMALSSADAWETPLGAVPVEAGTLEAIGHLSGVAVDDVAHAPEHSLEVQLPFLQTVLDDFVLVPVLVGDATVGEVTAVVDALWREPDTLVVVSTDLSHYLRYEDAALADARTAAAIVAADAARISDRDACGAQPLRGLLRSAGGRHKHVEQLDLRSSGDTAGDRERVVGYGAFALV